MPTSLPAQPNQSLIDGLAVLQSLAMSAEPIGSRELGRQLGLEPTRTNRLLKTLSALGIASQDGQRRYRPGPGMHVLAAQALQGSGLIRRAVPLLDPLRGRGTVIAIGTVWRGQVCYLYHASADTLPADAIGHRPAFPAWESGIGVAALTAASASELSSHLDAIPDRADRKRLRDLVALARRAGHARIPQPGGKTGIGVAVPGTAIALGVSGRYSSTAASELVLRLLTIADFLSEITS